MFHSFTGGRQTSRLTRAHKGNYSFVCKYSYTLRKYSTISLAKHYGLAVKKNNKQSSCHTKSRLYYRFPSMPREAAVMLKVTIPLIYCTWRNLVLEVWTCLFRFQAKLGNVSTFERSHAYGVNTTYSFKAKIQAQCLVYTFPTSKQNTFRSKQTSDTLNREEAPQYPVCLIYIT